MIKAVIFDHDGVIIDTEGIHFEADKELLAQFGITFTEQENLNYVGIANKVMYSELKGKHKLPLSVEELVRRKLEIDHKLVRENAKAVPYVVELIKLLHSAGYLLGIASSAERVQIEQTLTMLGVARFFKAVVSADDVPKAKPDPAVFLEAAKRIGVKNSECVVIEDSGPGVWGAKLARMFVIAAPNAYTLQHDFSKADLIVKSLKDITLETIKNMG